MSTTPDRPEHSDSERVDTGPSDTGPSDTGPSDTGPSDAWPSDSPYPDAAQTESGHPDTGQTDWLPASESGSTQDAAPPPAEYTSELDVDAGATAQSFGQPPPPPPAPTAPAPAGDYGPPAGYGSAPAYNAPAGAAVMLSPQEEKGWSLAAHLLVLVGGFVAPLIIWLVFKGRGPFLEHHAKESLNFQITVGIALIASIILMFLLIGFLLILVLLPWMVIMPILAAVKANNGEWFRYPLTLRLIT